MLHPPSSAVPIITRVFSDARMFVLRPNLGSPELSCRIDARLKFGLCVKYRSLTKNIYRQIEVIHGITEFKIGTALAV